MKALFAVLFLAGSIPAHADGENNRLLNDTFRVTLGGLYAESNTSARLGTSTGGVGVDVNFEDTLGLEERKWVGEMAMYSGPPERVSKRKRKVPVVNE